MFKGGHRYKFKNFVEFMCLTLSDPDLQLFNSSWIRRIQIANEDEQDEKTELITLVRDMIDP